MNPAPENGKVERLKVAFIGCGGNGRGHIRALAEMDEAALVGVCDTSEAAAHAAAEEYGSRPYTDFREMLDAETPEAVGISVPATVRGDIERELIARRIPFFIEKPVARDMATAREIEAAVAEAGIITSVGYQLRYTAAATAAKALLAKRRARMVVGRYWCSTALTERWHVKAAAGGQLLEQATHTLDMMRYLVGEIEEVFALESTIRRPEAETPDAHCVALRFAGGAVGSLTATWATAMEPGEANVLDIFYGRYAMHWTADAVAISPEPEPEDELPAAEPLQIDRVFVEAVRAGDASLVLSDYAEGVRSLAVSLAAEESSRTGRPVLPATI